MDFMKWLRWIGSAGSPRHRATPAQEAPQDDPDQTPATAQAVAAEIDLQGDAVLADAIVCARHALVMEFRERHRFDPTHEDLSDWTKSIWLDRDHVRAVIRRRNPMALSLGERFDTFWSRLEQTLLNRA